MAISDTNQISVKYGTSSTTACKGNDSRLSDARTPTAHNHNASDVTSTDDTTARLAGKVLDNAGSQQTLTISQVRNIKFGTTVPTTVTEGELYFQYEA